ncbi:MAG: hypothetical protein HWN65_12445 [Candidatus Helarchaeota archaeon]|nr:hypothetical protein [Candidatus Helarchaeota archaeon]
MALFENESLETGNKGDLSILEAQLLKFAERLAAANKIITIETLYKEISQNPIGPEEEISQAIYHLILKKYIVVGSKITRRQVLLNENRNRIYQHVLKIPGCHLSEIKQFMGMKGQLAKWHLAVLEKFDYVFSLRYLKYLTYFPNEFDENYVVPYLSLKNENSYQIFSTLWENPVLTLVDLKILLPMELPTLKYHLNKLIDSKVVQIQVKNNQSYYLLNRDVLFPLQQFLNINQEELLNFFQYQDTVFREKC